MADILNFIAARVFGDIEAEATIVASHTCTDEQGDGDPECLACGARDCPHGEPFHWHHDGCPACIEETP